MAFENFKLRHQSNGANMSKALRNQADMIMNATFDRDPSFRKVFIRGEEVDAKYLVHSYSSLSSDAVDYYVQFRPGVEYNIGEYIDIPNRNDDYERWLIVLKDDRPQFPLHYILKCDWTYKWVYNGKIYSCLGVLRSQSSYNSGVWTDYVVVHYIGNFVVNPF